MSSAYSTLVLVADNREVPLERVPLSGPESTEAYSESWLQDLVYRHPGSLPVADIDDSFSEMVPACREMATAAGPVDVLYVTPSGRLVVVEAKLWRNPEARRKVVGQILDYAKELTRWDFSKLDAEVRRARRKEDGGTGRGLLDLLGIRAGSPEAVRLHDSVTRGLRRGELLLLIVGDGIREGVGAITEFLENQGSLHFTFGLVEMAIYRMPDGAGQLVQPRVLAQSTIVRRTVVELRDGAIAIHDDSGEDDPAEGAPGSTDRPPAPEILENRRRFQAFWEAFLRELRLDDGNQVIGPAARAQNQFFRFSRETTAWVSAYVAESKQRAGVFLTFAKGPIGDRIYAALSSDRTAVERELGIPVEWNSDGEHHGIAVSRAFPGSFVDEKDVRVLRTLADWTNRFVSVFRPRVEKIARENL